MTTEEGNKLIAEFMDFSEMAPYNSSWDWLMSVVEKIENTGYYTIIYLDEDLHQCQITKPVPSYKCTFEDVVIPNDPGKYNSKIDAVFNTVVEFIQWYNQNSKA